MTMGGLANAVGGAVVSLGALAAVALLVTRWIRRSDEIARPRIESADDEPVPEAGTIPRRWPGGPLRIVPGKPSEQSPAARKPPTLIEVPLLRADIATRGPAAAEAELTRRHAAVFEMADAGRSAPDIARLTGRPIGEIELILALRRRARRASRPAGDPAGGVA